MDRSTRSRKAATSREIVGRPDDADARGNFMLEATRSGDTVFLEVSPNDLVHVQVEFS